MNPQYTTQSILRDVTQNPKLAYDPTTIKAYLSAGGALTNGGIPTTLDQPQTPQVAPTPQPPVLSSTEPRTQVAEATTQLSDFERRLKEAQATTSQIQQTAEQLKAQEKPKEVDPATSLAVMDEAKARGVQYDSTTGKLTGGTAYEQYLQRNIEGLDRDAKTIQDLLGAYSIRQTENERASIQAIQALYSQRKTQLADVNSRALAALKGGTIASGTERYAPEIATQLLSTEERAGVQRLSELDAEEAQLIASARNAFDEKSFRLLVQSIEQTNKVRKEKTQAVTDLWNMALKEQQILQDTEKAERDASAEAFNKNLRKTAGYALGISEYIDTLPTQQAKQEYIDTIARDFKLDPYILTGEVNKAIQSSNVKEIQRLNTESQIAARESQAAAREAGLGFKEQQISIQRERLALAEEKARGVPGTSGAPAGGGAPGAPLSKADQERNESLTDIRDLAKSLLTEKGKSGAIGAGFQKFIRGIPFVPGEGVYPGTAAASYMTGYNQLVSMLALPNLERLKGPLSDKDVLFLQNIGSRLSPDMKEKDFDRELNNIISKMNSKLGTVVSLEQQVKAKGYDYAAMRADGLTDDQIKKELGI